MKDSNTNINRLSAVGIIGNVLLSIFKFVAGILGNSTAIVSDAIHSLSDVVATVFAYFGAKIGRKMTDESHPYGHERIECIFTMAIGLILLGTGLFIGYRAVTEIISGSYEDITPEPIAIIAAIVSIIVKELMFQYTMHYAKILQCDAFKADAWRHRSDALTSIAALIGIGLAMMGFPIMDPVASIVICLFIAKMAIEIILDSINKTVDTPCDDDTAKCMKETVLQIDGVRSVDVLNTRMFGNRIYVDLEISVDGEITVDRGHEIAENVHLTLEKTYPAVKHVMVHVNPFRTQDQITE